jgi:hypothetical protein
VAHAASLDSSLRGRGVFRAPAAASPAWLLATAAAFGALYGLAMGSYGALTPERWPQLLYSAVKVPLLLFSTFGLCVPVFFVMNSLAGLRMDVRAALFALTAMQSCLAVVLAALAPVTLLTYAAGIPYAAAVFFNGVMFAVASASAQAVVVRYYGPLVREDPRHAGMLALWLALYVFVGIQGAWVMRPFVGNPDVPPQVLRPGAWGNAYVALIKLTRQVFQ